MPLETFLLAGALVTATIWAAFVLLRRDKLHYVGRGTLNAAAFSFALGAVVFVLVTLFMNGKPFLFGTELSLEGAAAIGGFLGAILGIGYFWISMALLPLGLLVGGGQRFATHGHIALTPVAFVGVVVVVASVSAIQTLAAAPAVVSGRVDISARGQAIGQSLASGAARCELGKDGSLRVTVDESVAPLVDGQGRQLTLALAVYGEPVELGLQLGIGNVVASPGKGWDPAASLELAPGWNQLSGRMSFSEVVPLRDGDPFPGERWSGNVDWSCGAQSPRL